MLDQESIRLLGLILRMDSTSGPESLLIFFLSQELTLKTARSWALAEIHNRAPIHEIELKMMDGFSFPGVAFI